MFKLIQNKITLINFVFLICAFCSHAQTTLTANSFILDQFKEMRNISYGNIVVDDMDGDGKKDIVASGNDTVSIFLNVSTNNILSFTDRINFYTGTMFGGGCVSSADFDGDGKQDIIVTNYYFSKISFLRNTSLPGNLSFAPKVDLISNAHPGFIITGDLNADGKPDIIVSNKDDSSVSVYKNTSSGVVISFEPKVDFRTSKYPAGISIADVDGDDKPDLVVADDSVNISILRNISTGASILFDTRFELQKEYSPVTNVVTGYLDADGKPDIVVNNYNSKTISTFRNTSSTGSISFETKVDHLVQNTTGLTTFNLSIGDADADGKTDVFVGCIIESMFGNGVCVLMKNESSTGNISFGSRVPIFQGLNMCTLAQDMQGDGKLDVMVLSADDHQWYLSMIRNRIGEIVDVILCPPFGNATLNSYMNGTTYQWQLSTDSINFINILNSSSYIGANSPTLVLNNLESSNYGSFYRCIVDGNISSTFKIKFQNVWGPYSVGTWGEWGKWSCNDLPDENTDVIISGNVTLTSNAIINSLTILPGGILTIASGFNLTVLH